MPKTSTSTDGEAWDALRTALDDAGALLRADRVDLHALGKALARIANASHRAFGESGAASLRLDAARRALDLRTPRSALEAFLARER